MKRTQGGGKGRGGEKKEIEEILRGPNPHPQFFKACSFPRKKEKKGKEGGKGKPPSAGGVPLLPWRTIGRERGGKIGALRVSFSLIPQQRPKGERKGERGKGGGGG